MVTFVFEQAEKAGCRDIVVQDDTGIYDLTNNPTGWDPGNNSSPNFKISDISFIGAGITFSDGSTVLVNIPTGGLFPGIGNNTQLVITSAIMGLGNASKPDGRTKIDISITCATLHGSVLAIPIEFSATYEFLWTCQAWCCVAQLATKIPKGKSGCTDCQHKKIFDEAYSLLVQANTAADCGNLDAAVDLLTQVQQICTSNNCNCS